MSQHLTIFSLQHLGSSPAHLLLPLTDRCSKTPWEPARARPSTMLRSLLTPPGRGWLRVLVLLVVDQRRGSYPSEASCMMQAHVEMNFSFISKVRRLGRRPRDGLALESSRFNNTGTTVPGFNGFTFTLPACQESQDANHVLDEHAEDGLDPRYPRSS